MNTVDITTWLEQNKNKIDMLLQKLDDYATDVDCHDYGLPVWDTVGIERMREIVLKWLRDMQA